MRPKYSSPTIFVAITPPTIVQQRRYDGMITLCSLARTGRAFNGSRQVVSVRGQVAEVQHPGKHTAEAMVVHSRGPRSSVYAKQFRQLDRRTPPREAVDHIRRLRDVPDKIREYGVYIILYMKSTILSRFLTDSIESWQWRLDASYHRIGVPKGCLSSWICWFCSKIIEHSRTNFNFYQIAENA